MSHRRIASTALCALAFASAAAATAGAASAAARDGSAATQLMVRVPEPGVYALSLQITAAHRRSGALDVRIGREHRQVAINAHRVASLNMRVSVGGRTLAISASDRSTVLRVRVKALRRLRRRRETPHSHRAPHGATGATGATGASGAVVAANTVAPAPAPPAPAPAATPAAPAGPPLPPAPGPAGPPGNPADWHMTFDDEFNATSLDLTKWSTGWFGSGITAPVNSEEQQCYDPSQVSESGGELDLSLVAKTESCGQTRPYASGLVTTRGKFSFTYGYLEARVWLPGSGTVNDWPAIWTDGQNWPTDGELDVLEGLGGQACWHFHDVFGAPGGCTPYDYTGAWHTFGADWEAGSATYYYDGNVVGSITSGITAAPMFIIMNLAVDGLYGGPVAAPATLRVDYVRVWQH